THIAKEGCARGRSARRADLATDCRVQGRDERRRRPRYGTAQGRPPGYRRCAGDAAVDNRTDMLYAARCAVRTPLPDGRRLPRIETPPGSRVTRASPMVVMTMRAEGSADEYAA